MIYILKLKVCFKKKKKKKKKKRFELQKLTWMYGKNVRKKPELWGQWIAA
jgi:hypothetical protein